MCLKLYIQAKGWKYSIALIVFGVGVLKRSLFIGIPFERNAWFSSKKTPSLNIYEWHNKSNPFRLSFNHFYIMTTQLKRGGCYFPFVFIWFSVFFLLFSLFYTDRHQQSFFARHLNDFIVSYSISNCHSLLISFDDFVCRIENCLSLGIAWKFIFPLERCPVLLLATNSTVIELDKMQDSPLI